MSITRHFTATGLVFNDQKQILLILHKKLKVWLPPGGHVEADELPSVAALREIFEETGVHATILPNHEFAFCGDAFAEVLPTPYAMFNEDIGKQGEHFHIDHIYLCYAPAQALQINQSETLDLGWFDVTQIENLEMYHNARTIIEQAATEIPERLQLFFNKVN